MPVISKTDRKQVVLFCLDQEVDQHGEVRVIDAFVNWLSLSEFKFEIKGESKEGRPAYAISDLLRLYIYGYLNRIRSSRQLEKQCRINIELQWLLSGLRPCHMTINNFRKNNPLSLVKVFRTFSRFLQGEGLYDEDTVAIDGCKYRAQNSKKNNYNEKKVADQLKYIDKQTNEYLEQLEQSDVLENSDDSEESRQEISDKLNKLSSRREKYEDLKDKIDQAHARGMTQVSTSDPDARALPKKMNIVEVSYNVVATAEAKNKLITNFEVTNKHDTHSLGLAAIKAKHVLGKTSEESIKVLADKGFDTGSELKKCVDHNIETYVAPKSRVSAIKNRSFNKDQFAYDHKEDYYECPAGERLESNGKSYERNKGKRRKSYMVRRYKVSFSICNGCAHGQECAGASNLSNSKGRYIERSEYADYVEENIERFNLNKELYRRRQEIIEHPFGTIKRQWGYDYTLLKSMRKVRGEFALIFTAYNLRRVINMLGPQEFMKRLEKEVSFYYWQLMKSFQGHTMTFFKSNSTVT